MSKTIPVGECYPFALRMAIDAEDDEFSDLSKLRVVHGTVTNKWDGHTYQHAWVEKGDRVFDWLTSATQPDGVPRDVFYDHYQPSRMTSYTAEQTMLNCARQRHVGPWEKPKKKNPTRVRKSHSLASVMRKALS